MIVTCILDYYDQLDNCTTHLLLHILFASDRAFLICLQILVGVHSVITWKSTAAKYTFTLITLCLQNLIGNAVVSAIGTDHDLV